MKTIKFKNLKSVHTGKTLEIEVPDDFDENNETFVEAGRRGAAFGKRFRKAMVSDAKNGDPRMLATMASMGELTGEARELYEKIKLSSEYL